MHAEPTPLPLRGLYVLADTSLVKPAKLAAATAAAIEGGAKLVQYRDKSGDNVRRWRDANRLLRLCRDAGIGLIVNDDVDLAAALGADGVHLGRDDAVPAVAKTQLPHGAIIGVSCYDSLARAEHAQAAGATYVAFGSFFPSTTKPNAARAPIGLLVAARKRLLVPIVAIGGINANNGGELIHVGADFLAVAAAVIAAGDISAAARRIAALFNP
ncbi:MAG TPA: thiamine phosphate synthase [Gammaproteobacteria bacterium]|nr:thiamine phosphate synthase [Gammaproteobacteria bacterium]